MFDNIVLFTELVERKSFTETSIHHNISQSTISKRIAALEEEVGATLIVHNTRKFELTKEGKLIYLKFKHLRKYLKDNLDLIQHAEAKEKTLLSVSISTSFAHEIICPYIEQFMEDNRNISLDMFLQHERLDDPLEQFDLTITNYPVNIAEYDCDLIRTEHAYLYCTPAYAEKYGLPTTIEELEQHRFVGIIANNPIHAPEHILFTNRYTKEEYLYHNNSRLKTNLPAHMQQIGLHGDYIFGSWGCISDKLVNSGELVKVLPEYQTYETEFFLVSHQGDLSSAENKFIDFIYNCVSKSNV